MAIVFKVLHIPSGEFVTAFRHSNITTEAIFYDSSSALLFLSLVVENSPYISGGPIHDYCLGHVPISAYTPVPLLNEFELLPFNEEDLPEIEQNRILTLKGYEGFFTKRNITNEVL